MIKQEFLNDLIFFSNKELNTPVLGLARSIMAFATLTTLFFNDISILFPVLEGVNSSVQSNYEFYFKKISVFVLCGYQYGKWISIIILIIVLSGWKPKYTCIFHWWICFSVFASSPSIDGGDQLLAVLTLFLIPICITDKRTFHWETNNSKQYESVNFSRTGFIKNSFFVAIRVQISYLYFQAAIAKFDVQEWRDGTVLYYWFNHPYFGLNDSLNWLSSILFYNYVSSSILTWSILILELLLFMALISDKKYRMPLFYFGITFHFFTWIVHGLFTFFLIMSAALILYLIPLKKEFDFSFGGLTSQKRLPKIFKTSD